MEPKKHTPGALNTAVRSIRGKLACGLRAPLCVSHITRTPEIGRVRSRARARRRPAAACGTAAVSPVPARTQLIASAFRARARSSLICPPCFPWRQHRARSHSLFGGLAHGNTLSFIPTRPLAMLMPFFGTALGSFLFWGWLIVTHRWGDKPSRHGHSKAANTPTPERAEAAPRFAQAARPAAGLRVRRPPPGLPVLFLLRSSRGTAGAAHLHTPTAIAASFTYSTEQLIVSRLIYPASTRGRTGGPTAGGPPAQHAHTITT